MSMRGEKKILSTISTQYNLSMYEVHQILFLEFITDSGDCFSSNAPQNVWY